jgi:hypothetical protein
MISPSATSVAWNRPLLWLAFAMAALTVVCLVGSLVDPRQLLGVGVWEKPLKFAISIGIYAITWSWLIGQLTSFRRFARVAAVVSVVTLSIEMVAIVGSAAIGQTSHFNVSTPFHTALWAVMAASIGVLWVSTFAVSIVLFRNRLGDRARSLAIRLGALIAVVGMALAFLMTSPTADQLNDYQGIVGAHTVGIGDGGPGLPVLGWSTVGGDLRIPHFIGMHSLQLIPLALIALELAARRVNALRREDVRFGLVWTFSVGYALVVALVTWQALRGQSIVAPDAVTLVAAAAILGAMVIGTVFVLVRPERRDPAGLSEAEALGGERLPVVTTRQG